MIQQSRLSNQILSFCRHLREKGFLIGPQETIDCIRAIQTIDLTDRKLFQDCLRLVLCSRAEEQPIFDHAFKEYFININGNKSSKGMLHYLTEERKTTKRSRHEPQKEKKQGSKGVPKKKQDSTAAMTMRKSEGETKAPEESTQRESWLAARTASHQAQNRQFYIPPDELGDMEDAAKMFVNQVRLKKSRSFQTAGKGAKFNFRRTIRKSLQTGGYPVHLSWKREVNDQAKFVLLCDASRSMSLYSQRFLQFAYALSKCTKHVEVFLFSTKLKRVTDQIIGKGSDLPVLYELGESWGGGTRIGESIESFVRGFGPMLLNKDSIVMIASDGLDAGDVSHLGWAMKEIQRRTSAVLWFNPLLNIEGYEPAARGMRAALPYIDFFSEAADAASFLRLAKKIQIRR